MQIICLVRDEYLPALESNAKKNMLQLDEKYIEERAFFYKIVGDYFRYASEATTIPEGCSVVPSVTSENLNEMDGPSRKAFFKKGALEAYSKCNKIGGRLKPYNCVRLGLALNFSVFQFEIMQDVPTAIEIASDALT